MLTELYLNSQAQQNAAVRLMRTKRTQHITAILAPLQWLPLAVWDLFYNVIDHI